MNSLIGAVFGLVYVLVNAGKLPDVPATVLRIAAILAFVAVYLAIRKVPADEDDDEPAGPGFGRRYWLIVIAEIAAIFIGLAVIAGPVHHEQASVAWISLVVGLHFFALARLWEQPAFHVLGGLLTGCGLVGLVLALAGAGDAVVASVGGIIPGVVLLGAGWLGARATQYGSAVS